MAQIFIPVTPSPEPYAYIRRGEWGFGRVEGVGAEIPNLAVVAWADGRLTDDDLAWLVFVSYRAWQEWHVDHADWWDESPDWCDMRYRLAVWRAFREMVA